MKDSHLSLRQVVLKALDPVFEIEDPYAYNIQGNETAEPLGELAASLLLMGDIHTRPQI